MTDAITDDEALTRLKGWASSKKMVKADAFNDVVAVTVTQYVQTRVHTVTDIVSTERGEGRAKRPGRTVTHAAPAEVLAPPTDKKSLKSGKGERYQLRGSEVYQRCDDCSGQGRKRHEACNGRGEVRCPPQATCTYCNGRGRTIELNKTGGAHCTSCNGRGSRICKTCKGTGFKKCTRCTQGKVRCAKCEEKGTVLTYTVVQGQRRTSCKEDEFEPTPPPKALVGAFAFAASEYHPDVATPITPVESTQCVRQVTVLDVAEIKYRADDQVHTAYVYGNDRLVLAPQATTVRRRVLTVLWLLVLAAIIAGIVLVAR